MLQEVISDIAITELPSRIGRVPANVGSAGAGTLSADQWRTLCMVHLVITLTRLCGNVPAEDRRRQLLDNFLDLVAAVRYANVRRTSPSRIATYNSHIFQYVRGLRRLFPEQDLVPNQHLALHLGEVLENFGPSHAYWAFPFERLIRIVRQANINFRHGILPPLHTRVSDRIDQYEHTGETEMSFLNTFCSANNLKILMVSKRLPEVLHDFADLIDCAFTGASPAENHTANASVYGPNSEPLICVTGRKATMLPREIYEALHSCISTDPYLRGSSSYRTVYEVASAAIVLNAEAEYLNHVSHRGVRYSTHAYHAGDSHVLYKVSSADRTHRMNAGALALGRIHMIFAHKRLQADGQYRHQVFVAIRPFTALSEPDGRSDPYRRYSALRATLVYSSPSSTLRVVPIHDVVAQFVGCPYREPITASTLSRQCMIAIPLDEVRVA